MFESLTLRLNERTVVLNRFLSICDLCDEVASNAEGALFSEISRRANLSANLREEKIFRHCAIVNQLYSIYEAFAEAVLGVWLSRLPHYKLFDELPNGFKNSYRCGIARIIQDSEKRKYRHVSLIDVLDRYLSSLRGETPWEFVGEALIAHDRNLRRSELEQLFHSAGLIGVWSALERNPAITCLTVYGDSNKSLEQMILDLVTYRNDASHGTPDEILGIDTLREWIVFVKAFCESLASFIAHRIGNEQALSMPETVYGVVTETFRNNIAIIKCDRGIIREGEYLYFLRDADCTRARINSIQVNDVNQDSVEIKHEGFEVGIQTSVKVPRSSRVLKINDFL
ncbi:MAG: MAE_28990/MAE_18760 family HEPN-like nuclease [Desulfobacterales bacterium]